MAPLTSIDFSPFLTFAAYSGFPIGFSTVYGKEVPALPLSSARNLFVCPLCPCGPFVNARDSPLIQRPPGSVRAWVELSTVRSEFSVRISSSSRFRMGFDFMIFRSECLFFIPFVEEGVLFLFLLY